MKYTKNYLLKSLERFYVENGRVPIANDFCNDTKYPSVGIIIRYFGSWNNAIRDAGLWDNRIIVKITDDKLLCYMKQFYKENGRVPTHYDFNSDPNYPSFGTYIKRFGSWNNAIREAGLWDNRIIVRITDDELLEYLTQFYEKNGRIPTCYDFNNDPNYPSFATYQKRFGGWNKALKAAGLQVNRFTKMTNEELLGYLKMFYEENGRSPVVHDFINNHKYPSLSIYIRRFGGWQKALKLVGLDMDTTIRKGILENTSHKGRLFEICVKEHFIEESIDLSIENYGSVFDGICPKGQIYDAKSSGLIDIRYWLFILDSACRDEIEWFYLGAFDKGYNKLLHVWRIPGDFIDGNSITIGINISYTYNIENMKEYEITEKFKDVFENIFE